MKWLTKRLRGDYAKRLVRSHLDDNMDDVVDREIQKVLLQIRCHIAYAPLVHWWRAVTGVWRLIYGRYWKSRQAVHVGTAQAAGGNTVVGAGFSNAGLAAAVSTVFGPATGGTVSPAPTQSFEDAGVRAGEVVAYRCWVLRDGLLYSAFRDDFLWPPGEVVEGKPDADFEGVHGFKKRWDACSYIESYEIGPAVVVSGTVELWGDVYEHQRGYRASRAEIASIDDSPNYDAAALRKTYGLGRKRRVKK